MAIVCSLGALIKIVHDRGFLTPSIKVYFYYPRGTS
jgi:hypothetical protein